MYVHSIPEGPVPDCNSNTQELKTSFIAHATHSHRHLSHTCCAFRPSRSEAAIPPPTKTTELHTIILCPGWEKKVSDDKPEGHVTLHGGKAATAAFVSASMAPQSFSCTAFAGTSHVPPTQKTLGSPR